MAQKFDRMDFLEALFEQYYESSGNFIIVKTTAKLERPGEIKYFPGYDKLANAKFPDNTHVLFGVCPREKMKPEKEHIRYVTALWAGLDIGPDRYSGSENYFSNSVELTEAILQFPLRPSILVRSGEGAHLYWLLKDVMELAKPEALEGLLCLMNKSLRCETRVGADSLMRLPGTANPRYAKPHNDCYVEFLDPDLRYGANDFKNLEGKLPKPGRPPAAAHPENAGNDTESVESSEEVEYAEIVEELDDSFPGLSEEQLDSLAEKIVEKFSGRLVDTLAERITAKVADATAERIAQKLQALASKR